MEKSEWGIFDPSASPDGQRKLAGSTHSLASGMTGTPQRAQQLSQRKRLLKAPTLAELDSSESDVSLLAASDHTEWSSACLWRRKSENLLMFQYLESFIWAFNTQFYLTVCYYPTNRRSPQRAAPVGPRLYWRTHLLRLLWRRKVWSNTEESLVEILNQLHPPSHHPFLFKCFITYSTSEVSARFRHSSAREAPDSSEAALYGEGGSCFCSVFCTTVQAELQVVGELTEGVICYY